MHAVKRTYIDVMQSAAGIPPFSAVSNSGAKSDAYGWGRWVSSLFAIYDTDRMIELDLPWWNVEATRTIEEFLAGRPNARIFEYGSGASTVWLAKRSGAVTTVEHDRDWLNRFKKQTEAFDNVELRFRPIDGGPGPYVNAIAEEEDGYDLIVVDGRHRNACLKEARARLNAGGIIVFDDSGRKRYRDAIESCGLSENRFYGRSFCVPYPDYTSLLTDAG